MNKISVLFNVIADADNTNAQSLNARDIGVRLESSKFEIGFFISDAPDPRIKNQSNVRLIQLHRPSELMDTIKLYQFVWGKWDIIFYPPRGNLWKWYEKLEKFGKEKKIITTIEGTASQIQNGRSNTEKMLSIWSKSNKLISISSYIADSIRDKFGFESEVIRLGVNTNLFSPNFRQDESKPVKILYVGTIQPRKRVHKILDYAEELPGRQVEFNIIGPPIFSEDYYKKLLDRKKEKNLTHVNFLGKKKPTGVRQWMRSSDVFILPSKLEGTPKVTFEAAASGLPCIIYKDYHTPTVVDGETGFEVENDSQFLSKLKLLIEKPDKRRELGEKAVEHIRQFDWDLIVKDWEKEILDLI